MFLKTTCELHAYMHNDKTFLVITRVKERMMRYFNGHAKVGTCHWMTPDYWAEYEAGLEKIFDNCNDKSVIDENFDISPVVHVNVKSISTSKKPIFRLLNVDNVEKENVALQLECIVNYSDETKNSKTPEFDEEYQPAGNIEGNYVKYIPSKSPKCSPTKVKKESYAIFSNTKCLPSKVKKESCETLSNTTQEKSETPTKKKKKYDTDAAQVVTKQSIETDHDYYDSQSLRRSARSPSKPKYLLDSVLFPYVKAKKSANKCDDPATHKNDNNNEVKRKLDWNGKILNSLPIKKKEGHTSRKKITIYADSKNEQNGERQAEENARNRIEPSNAPSIEQLENKELELNKKIGDFLSIHSTPPPPKVEYLPLDFRKSDIKASFAEFKGEFDKIISHLKHKVKITNYNGVDNYTVSGLIPVEVQDQMMTNLSVVYDMQLISRPRIQIYANALLPEWTVRLFMKKYKLSRSDAVKQIVAQRLYKEYTEAESPDLDDLFT